MRAGLLVLTAAVAVAHTTPTSTITTVTVALQTPAAERAIVVISDLHLGVGRDSTGQWHPYEDFRWSQEFAAFLGAVDREGRSAVDLVLNGDTFELLQTVEPGCGSTRDSPGCSEPEVLARLERVLAAHRTELAAISRFARDGSNRVVFVPGDHDAALLMPRVGQRVVEALGTVPAGRATVAAAGYWHSADGRVHAEHGHQIGFSPHAFDRWPSPFGRDQEPERLDRPWGEALIQPLVDQYEARYPIVDNMAAAALGVKYAIGADAEAGVDALAPSLVRYFLSIISWQQFRMELDDGEVEPPVWNVEQARGQGAAFLVSALPDDDPLKPAVRAADVGLAAVVRELTDEQIVAICDYRAAVRRSRRRLEQVVTQFAPRGPVVTECQRTPETRGARFDYFWRSRDLVFERHLERLQQTSRKSTAGVEVFVHGHTHLADRSQYGANMISGNLLKIPMEGFSPVRGALTPIAINGGAWQRTMTPVQYERLRTERGLTDADLLRTLQPEDLPACYSFVSIPPYAATPAPSVRYWRRAGTTWEFAGSCAGGS